MAPRVSVIVPCYNLGRYLAEAVDSVLAQTLQDVEVIVVDDGSTEAETQRIVAAFSRPKTRVIRRPHAGLAAARNAGIAAANADILCALDADDRLEPTYFDKAIAVLDRDRSVTFVSAWLRTFGEESWDWTPARCDLPTLLWEDTVLTAALVRRDAVVAAGCYDAAMPVQGDEDWDLWLTLVERGHRGVILPEILFNYRRRAGSMATVCWHGDGHVPLARYRIAKHAGSYRERLFDVLLHQDEDTAALLRRNDELERYVATDLAPSVAARRAELQELRAKLAAAAPVPAADDARVADLEAALRIVAAEANALRGSMSWKITAPLRSICGRWLEWRR
ncbi:MAG TPA: glycosyltransferase [Vicinamibacterales bacterium]|nr:glycosyltransferase [Vicinamibacterales bacterium]